MGSPKRTTRILIGAACAAGVVISGGYLMSVASETGYGGLTVDRTDVIEINTALADRLDAMVETHTAVEVAAYLDYIDASGIDAENVPYTPQDWVPIWCHIQSEYPEMLSGFEDRFTCG